MGENAKKMKKKSDELIFAVSFQCFFFLMFLGIP